MTFDDPIATFFQEANIETKNINPVNGLQLLDGETIDDSEALQTVKEPTSQGGESFLEESTKSSEALKTNTSYDSGKIIERNKNINLISLSEDHDISEVILDDSDTHHLNSEQFNSSFIGASNNNAVEIASATCRPIVEVNYTVAPIKMMPAEGINSHDDGMDENKGGRLQNDQEEEILTKSKVHEQCTAGHISGVVTTHPAIINDEEQATECRKDDTDCLNSSMHKKTTTVNDDSCSARNADEEIKDDDSTALQTALSNHLLANTSQRAAQSLAPASRDNSNGKATMLKAESQGFREQSVPKLSLSGENAEKQIGSEGKTLIVNESINSSSCVTEKFPSQQKESNLYKNINEGFDGKTFKADSSTAVKTCFSNHQLVNLFEIEGQALESYAQDGRSCNKHNSIHISNLQTNMLKTEAQVSPEQNVPQTSASADNAKQFPLANGQKLVLQKQEPYTPCLTAKSRSPPIVSEKRHSIHPQKRLLQNQVSHDHSYCHWLSDDTSPARRLKRSWSDPDTVGKLINVIFHDHSYCGPLSYFQAKRQTIYQTKQEGQVTMSKLDTCIKEAATTTDLVKLPAEPENLIKYEYESSCGQPGGSPGKILEISLVNPMIRDTESVFGPQSCMDENLHIAKQEPVHFEECATSLTEELSPSDTVNIRNNLADKTETEALLLFGSPCLEIDSSLCCVNQNQVSCGDFNSVSDNTTVSWKVNDNYQRPEAVSQKSEYAKVAQVVDERNSSEIHSTNTSKFYHKNSQAQSETESTYAGSHDVHIDASRCKLPLF